MIRSLRAVTLVVLLWAVSFPVTALGLSPATPFVDGSRFATTSSFEPLPVCRYVDISTRFRTYAGWRKTLLDTNLRVGRAYKPRDLVSTSLANISGGGEVRRVVIDDLRAMAAAARDAGAAVAVRSAYRSYTQQEQVFNGWVEREGYERALLISARPGHSEHQLGTAIDFRSADSSRPPWDYTDWGATPAGRWMQQNAWKFGWVMSYPAGAIKQVCYSYEPWHWRYLGRREARAVHESGLTLRKFLWRRFESQ